MGLLADEPIVLVVGIVLGVPLELGVEVHVEVGVAGGLLVVLEVGEGHGLPRDPLQPLVPVCVEAAQPVVSPVLGVDDSQDALDEIILRCVEDVSQVASDLVTLLLRPEVVLVVAGEQIAVAAVVNPAQAVSLRPPA